MTLEKIINFILALTFVGIPSLALFMGALGRQSKMKSVMFVVPFVSVILVVNHQFHLQLILMGVILPFYLPEQIVHRPVGLGVLVPFLVFAGMVARTLMGKTNTKTSDKVLDLIMGLVSFETVLWVVIKFPGLGSLGSSEGGGWHSILAISGLCAYWGARSLRGIKPDWERLMKLLLGVSIVGVAWLLLLNAYQYRSIGAMISACFFSTGWWFYGLYLGVAVKIWRRSDKPMGMVPAYAVSGMLLVHALMSSYRSRILFAPFMVGVALWSGGMRKLMIISTIAFFSICVMLANGRMYNRLPGQVRRVLSVVRLEDDNLSDARELGEMGPNSPWRMQLWASAWEEIKRRPVIGHGYTHNSALFISSITSPGSAYYAKLKGLVLSGEAHNTPLNLMYYWGVPMALVFCFGWVLHLKNLLSLASKHDGWFGAFLVALLVWTVAETGQALMNGTGGSFVSICTSMGIYQAIKPEKKNNEAEVEESV